MIAERCDKTGRGSLKTIVGSATTSIKTIGIVEETDGILGWTNRPFVRTVNHRGRMNGAGPMPKNSSRIGNTCGTAVGMSEKIDVISVPIVRSADRIDAEPKRIKVDGITIGKTYEPIIKGLEVRLHTRVRTLGKPQTAAPRTIGSDSVGR